MRTEQEEQKPYQIWPCVFEVSDAFGPRRCSNQPRLKVEAKTFKPGCELNQWARDSKSAKKAGIVRVRYDLMPKADDKGGAKWPFMCPEEKARYKVALSILKRQLRDEGYTVNGILTLWRLYAIKLKTTKKTPKNVIGSLYVGQTELAVEQRIKQHQLGHEYPWKGRSKHSRVCHSRFIGPCLQLIPESFKRQYLSNHEALVAESQLRIYFEQMGYEVIGGQEQYEEQSSNSLVCSK